MIEAIIYLAIWTFGVAAGCLWIGYKYGSKKTRVKKKNGGFVITLESAKRFPHGTAVYIGDDKKAYEVKE